MRNASSSANIDSVLEYKNMHRDRLHIYIMIGEGGLTKQYLSEDGKVYGTVLQVVVAVEYGATENESKVACIHIVAQDPLSREMG